MNKRDWVVLAMVANGSFNQQRKLAQRAGYSLGLVNASLKALVNEGYLTEDYRPTEKTHTREQLYKPQRAVVLAAGPGLRMVPINRTPKGLLEVGGEVLIERILRQLHENGIEDITVVVGYMAAKFEYLQERFGVKLLYNAHFAEHDSMYSLALAADKLENCYVVPCDVWFARTPFSRHEYYSWYGISELVNDDSLVRMNRKMELVRTDPEFGGNSMTGVCYLTGPGAVQTRAQLLAMNNQRRYAKAVWEEALFDEDDKMRAYAKVMRGQSAYEIKTYENLRDIDSDSRHLDSRRIQLIKEVFGVEEDDICEISGLFRGMTNRLMRFTVHGTHYLFRVPGEGSGQLTNRHEETAVYKALENSDLPDKVVYINPDTGYKITEFWDNARSCNPKDTGDVRACMQLLRRLHEKQLLVEHTFDIWQRLEEYEKLCEGHSDFVDYAETRRRVFALRRRLAAIPKDNRLCHIDPVPENFLFVGDEVHLIDWEYAGMCDPHIDIAMFCISAGYTKEEIDHTIDIYFNGHCDDETRGKIYAYVASCALLWTVWSEYKYQMGVDYSEYKLRQYSYAKTFPRHAMQLLGDTEEDAS